MELKIDINDAMKMKEYSNAIIEDGESVDLLAEYIRTDLGEDAFGDYVFGGLEYFLNNRGLEINWNKRLEMMDIINTFWMDVIDEADECGLVSGDKYDFLGKKSEELAKKIIGFCEPLGTITQSDGTIKLPDDFGKESVNKERITFTELDRRIGGSILCNNMGDRFGSTMELVSGEMYEKDEFGREEGDPVDIFQYYFISDSGADYLKNCTDQLVFYDDELDVYVWGITHLGTSWDYVYIDIHY